MTPEEQYVKFMDAAYAAADRETYFKMRRKAEGVLRGEFGTSQPMVALSQIILIREADANGF